MAESTTEIDLDSVIDRLLEGALLLSLAPSTAGPSSGRRTQRGS
jgi:hypothetical protein